MEAAAPLSGREILLVEDDPTLRRRLAAHLKSSGAEVSVASNLAEARRLLADFRFDFAVLDLHLPDGEALELLRERAFSENTAVVVMTAFGGVGKAVEAMRLGAGDYLTKPFEPGELLIAFRRCRDERTARRRDEHQSASGTGEWFFGRSLGAVQSQLESILAAERRLERHLPPVLIEGETGTGKSALARWLHRHGPRAAAPFVALNCAALPEQLAESELFGHERGAFTDAKRARLGLFEAADGGTLFLDEIGSLSAPIQAKLLTALEDGRIRRLGGAKELSVDTRIVAANNRPLQALVAAGAFREDLFHRLNLLRVTLPPLRERGSDVLDLARHLLRGIAARHRMSGIEISPAGAQRLLAQRWPGNVRELAHELERAMIFHPGGPLDFAHLGEAPSSAPAAAWRNPAWRLPENGFSLDAVNRTLIDEALRECDGNVSAAARRLGVTRDFLRYHLAAAKDAAPPPASG